jgi:segregation and condensation protein A
VELKTRRLLPGPADLELDEELLRFEERDLLLARLLECKTFKDASDALLALMRVADRSLPRVAGPEEPFRSLVPDPLSQVRPERLRDAARKALEARPLEEVETDHIAPIRVSVADAISVVLDRLQGRDTVRFRELASDAPTRLDAIVRFLAVLELFKQGIVDLDQAENFGALEIRRLAGTELDAESIADWDHDARDERPSDAAAPGSSTS